MQVIKHFIKMIEAENRQYDLDRIATIISSKAPDTLRKYEYFAGIILSSLMTMY